MRLRFCDKISAKIFFHYIIGVIWCFKGAMLYCFGENRSDVIFISETPTPHPLSQIINWLLLMLILAGKDHWINIESTSNQPIYVDSLLIQCNLRAGMVLFWQPCTERALYSCLCKNIYNLCIYNWFSLYIWCDSHFSLRLTFHTQISKL